MIRIHIACPEGLAADANQLARAIGLGPADDQTYGAPGFQDAAGARFAFAGVTVGPGFLAAATSPLVEPAWGADMAAARRAQAAIRMGGLAAPGRLTVVVGDDPWAALAEMGLTQAPGSPL